MRVRTATGEAFEEVAHFVGPAPEPVTAPSDLSQVGRDPEVLRMRAEVERLNTELTRRRPGSERSRSRTFATPAVMESRVAANSVESVAEMKLPPAPPELQISPSVMPSSTQPPFPVQPVLPPQKPASGRSIWTGQLPRGGLLLIGGQRASVGTLTRRFPLRVARVAVYPADLSDAGIVIYARGAQQNAVEAPSAANGWNLTTYKPDAKRSRAVTVLEYPGQQNDWARLLIRCEDRPVSMLAIDWEEMPASGSRQ